MSYCRLSDPGSDLYVYDCVDGYLICAGCDFAGKGWAGSFTTTSRGEMVEHMLEHRKAGHGVPEYALERLREEIAELGDDVDEE